MFLQRSPIYKNELASLNVRLITSPIAEHEIQEACLGDIKTTSPREIGEGDLSYDNLNCTVYGYFLTLDEEIIGGEKIHTSKQLCPGDTLRLTLTPCIAMLRYE